MMDIKLTHMDKNLISSINEKMKIMSHKDDQPKYFESGNTYKIEFVTRDPKIGQMADSNLLEAKIDKTNLLKMARCSS